MFNSDILNLSSNEYEYLQSIQNIASNEELREIIGDLLIGGISDYDSPLIIKLLTW